MRKLLTVLCAVAFVMTACKKEPSFEDPTRNPGGGSPGGGNPGGGGGGSSNSAGLLARLVLSDDAETDSSVYLFTYDAAKRLSRVDVNSGGVTEQIRFQRDAAGLITQSIIKSTDVSDLGIDSLITRYHYSTAQSRYQSVVFDLPAQSLAYSDSTVFVYDASGLLAGKISYAAASGASVPIEKFEFAYTGGNMTSMKNYEYDGAWQPVYTFDYTYDSKVNPLQIGVEALLVDAYAMASFGLNTTAIYFGANNASVVAYSDADVSDNYALSSTFTYNAANKPVAGTATETPGGGAYKWRFDYY